MFKIVSDELPYEVNEQGIVRNKSTKHVYSQQVSDYGYVYVSTKYRGKRCYQLVHRLIARAFLPNLENKPQVNHKDGIKANNWKDNLEWHTQSENIKHAYSTGLMIPLTGAEHYATKHTEQKVREACQLLSEGVGNSVVAAQCGMSNGFIGDLKFGHSWKHVVKEYNIPRKKRIYVSEEAIHFICKHLELGYSSASLCRLESIHNFSSCTVNAVRSRKRHTLISQHYNF